MGFTENLLTNSKKLLPLETNCADIYSIPLIRELYDSEFYQVYYKACEPSFTDVHFSVVFNPVRNINIEIVSQTINPKDNCRSIQDVVVHFLIKLKEAKYFLEHHLVVSSSIVDKLRNEQYFLKLLKLIKRKNTNKGVSKCFYLN